MKQHYTPEWLIDKYYNDEPLKYLYFWGHTNKLNEETGKFCFSQCYKLPFTVDGVTYNTAEHWMMAQKALLFEDFKSHEKIINAVKPGKVKELGRRVTGFDETRWNEYRYSIVVTGNIHNLTNILNLPNTCSTPAIGFRLKPARSIISGVLVWLRTMKILPIQTTGVV